MEPKPNILKFMDKLLQKLVWPQTQNKRFSLFAVIVSACGSKSEDAQEPAIVVLPDVPPTPTTPTPQTNNHISHEAGTTSTGLIGINDTITANSETFINGSTIVDLSPYDDDKLIITATEDISDTPTVKGIESIIFTTAALELGGDTIFDINLNNISEYKLLQFQNSNPLSPIKTLNLYNVSSDISTSKDFPEVKIDAKPGVNINLVIEADIDLSTTGQSKDLNISAGGKNVTLTSSQNKEDIIISNANQVDVTATSATGNFQSTANGNVVLRDLSSLKGNVEVQSVGSILVKELGAVKGSITLNNERDPSGNDIVITNAASAGSFIINSSGGITATGSGGLKSAEIINATMAHNSVIYADGVEGQVITLNAQNKDNQTLTVSLSASKLETLNVTGTSPIIIDIDGEDISTETITNSNPNTVLRLTSSNSDLSNASTNIKYFLANQDGKAITVKNGQNYYFDAEGSQTANLSKPQFKHLSDAKSSTSNSMDIKTHDSKSSNLDSTVNLAGLEFIDIQTLNVELSNSIGIDSTGDFVGEDLTKLAVTGSGNFNLNENTISGNNVTGVQLDASSLSGAVTIKLDNTTNGVKNLKTGKGADLFIIDVATNLTGGIVILSGDGKDTFNLTVNADGPNAKLNLDGGNQEDVLLLDAGIDLSSSDLTLSNIEKIMLKGGGVSQIVSSSDISGKAFEISEGNYGIAQFTINVDQTSVDLSNLTFDASYTPSVDTLLVNAANSSAGVTITGAEASNIITGSNANDIIKGGNLNDSLTGGTGNDTLEGKLGSDTINGGAGDDEFDFTSGSSTISKMDKIADYQAAAAENHNDTLDTVTGSKGANVSSIDVKNAIFGGNGSETVTAAVTNGILTLSGSDKGLINTLQEWYDVTKTDGVIAVAADDADATGTIAFQFSGNTYVVESNDTFNNNTANVSIENIIELTGLTGVTAVADAAAANTILIA